MLRAISNTLQRDQWDTVQLITELDERYFRLMAEASQRLDSASGADCATLWRMQWLFDYEHLPHDRVPGFVNLEQLIRSVSGELPPALEITAREYRAAVGPLLAQLQHALLFERYDGSILLNAVRMQGQSHDHA